MGLFHRRSKWERLSQPVARAMPSAGRAAGSAARSALGSFGMLVGVSAASAAVTAVRQRKLSE